MKAPNAPHAWWIQGERGNGLSHPGGWFRVFGKNLGHDGRARAVLHADGGDRPLEVGRTTPDWLALAVPDDAPEGTYEIRVHNGPEGDGYWTNVGELRVERPDSPPPSRLDVLDFGADSDGKADCATAVREALDALGKLGGGTLYFPRGRYRIDAGSPASGGGPLKIPSRVALRGEGADLVSLWWPDQKEPLPVLLDGGEDLTVEDLSIYTQGRHRNILRGGSRTRVRRVRIRANCYYMTGAGGRRHHLRSVEESPALMGTALEIAGDDIAITDCDIYHSAAAISLARVSGGYVARNTVRAASMIRLDGGRGVIIEGNTLEGNQLATKERFPILNLGSAPCENLCFAENSAAFLYGGQDEIPPSTAREPGHLFVGNTVRDCGRCD